MAKKKAPQPLTPPQDIKLTVENWENVSKFLRGLANNVAIVPNYSAEIVRSCLIVATFLDDRAAAVRKEAPQEFEKKEEPSERVAARR